MDVILQDHGQGNLLVTIQWEWSFKNGDPSMISTLSRRNKGMAHWGRSSSGLLMDRQRSR